MTSRVLPTLGFTVLYLLATYCGRLTVLDGTNLSLVWPAAGIGAVWFAARLRSRTFWLDVVAMSAATAVGNMATGAPAALAAWFIAANLTQALIFAWLLARWLPGLWGGGGDQPMSRLAHLWRLLGISAISTACGAALGPTGSWLVNGVYSAPATAVWMTRNTASMLIIGAAGLRLGHLLRQRRSGRLPSVRTAWREAGRLRRCEYVCVTVLSAVAYVVGFGLQHDLPLAFPLIVMTVWAGLRLHTTFVIAHDLFFGAVAVGFTLAGRGPFAAIDSYSTRALIVQLFVGVVAVVGLAVALGRDERTALVAKLRQAQVAAAQQARLLGSVVDAMSEGLAVIDEDGTVLLRNPAAAKLLGDVRGELGRPAAADFAGLRHRDGTVIAPEELPDRQALATGEPHGMDVIVRDAGRGPAVPQERILAVRATPIPGLIGGRRCAVSVFSDVTADRRHRDELASFAGVVAHDLCNPLTVVEGWSEELADVPDAADGIARIGRAATRMRNLINDLLAYTTARDATPRPAALAPADIVAQIALDRADQALSAGAPAPRIDVGELPEVYADPALIRQLFDNLIGNAVKYTAAGVTPQVTVTGAAVDGERVRIAVADNGIGIPAGQHEAVFDNFHRAHPDGRYPGTGLGLAICKRIVERHGGTIEAADNPTGAGAVVTFTLPAAATPSPTRSDLVGAASA